MRHIETAALLALLLTGCSRPPEPPRKTEPTSSSPAAHEPVKRPANVLLVTIDTLRADYLGCYGRDSIATPNIDKLAARGVRFSQAIAQVPLTAPSHASILTGAYPPRHKLRDMGGFVLDGKIPTLATLAAAVGFETAAFVGSSVLHHSYGLNRGFTTYVDDMHQPRGTKKLPGVVAEVRGEAVTQRALDWLAKTSGKRFFLWAHYYDPHFPYDPPEPYRSRYPKDLYGAEVSYTDAQVGRLLDEVARRGDDTLVVLLADHGESLGEHGEYTHGVFLYDSTVHVPLIVAGPGIAGGRVVAPQVRSIDVLPTICDLLGLAPGDQAQGASLAPSLLEGKPVRPSYCYLETVYPRSHMGWSELRAMRIDDWKLVAAPKSELYRVAQDRKEVENVLGAHRQEADALERKIWEIAGARAEQRELQPQPVDEERRRQLQSLGYVNSGVRPLRMDMSGPDPKDRVASLEALEHAGRAMNQDRFQEGARILEAAVRQDPGNPQIYTELGLCYQNLRQFDRAERTYREAIRNKADGDQTYAELGEIYIRRGDLPHAVEFMERAARLNPVNLENMLNLATAYLHLPKLEETERVLRAILVQNEPYAAAHNLFGILEIQRGRAGAARGHFEKAVQYNPELAESYMNLGLLAQNAGDSQAAIGYYRQFLKRASPAQYGEVIPKVKAALADLGATP
jgi:choline-sulfatase